MQRNEMKNLDLESDGKTKAFMGNPLLKKHDEASEWTVERLEEFKKCKENPIYFLEKYMTIVNIDRGKELIKLYPYQKKLLDTFFENRFNIVLSSRQSGKCVDYNTKIKVRNKKSKKIEEISIGDFFEKMSKK